jgi:tight adherence protein C
MCWRSFRYAASSGWITEMNPLSVAVVFAFLSGAVTLGVYVAVFDNRRALEDRMRDLAVKMRIAQGAFADETDETFARLLLEWAIRHLPKPKTSTPNGEKIAQSLIHAGYLKSAAPQIYQLARLLCVAVFSLFGLAVGLLAGQSANATIVYTLFGAVMGGIVPAYYVANRARKRQTAIARELSDMLDLLVVCVEAGLGLYEAIQVVGTEAERHGQVIGRELSLVASEVSSGASLGMALRNMAERTAVEDVKPLAATLIQSEQLGAQIAPALRASSDTMRTRRRLRAEEAAQKTAVKILFPLVLFVLPAMLMVIVGPAMIQILHTLRR